jgi:anaerobic selenocysteine-containing dehydrogenase
MTRLGEALTRTDDPPVKAFINYNSNPGSIAPDRESVIAGLRREDLFSVVLEHFQTDTADYADLLLPATMQTEHPDLHYSFGHIYVAWNEPAVSPPGECLSNSEIFRRLAGKLGLTEPCLYDSDEEMARQALNSEAPALAGITLERLKRDGWARLNVPTPFVPFADGFLTTSRKLEFVSPRMAAAGLDPIAGYTPPYEAAQRDTDLARRFPLALIAPAAHYFLNHTFANVRELAVRQGAPAITLHPADAEPRGLKDGDLARVHNDRGEYRATVRISDRVRRGVVEGRKGYWPKLSGGANPNATVAERDSDMGGGAVFHDNRVEVSAVR